MSKPLADDPDMPPEPSPLDDDLPPSPQEPSVRSRSKQLPALNDDEDDAPAEPAAPSALAEELLGSADKASAVSARAEGDVLTVGGATYRLMKRLGAGGMGEVFLARKQGTGGFERDVALKTILPVLSGHKKAATFLKGFNDEARLAALLHHPNICQVYDLQPLEGRGLIQVLEYIPGRSLKEIIEAARTKRAGLSEPFACFVAAELASALEYAHTAADSSGRQLGVVHRDVTPHNIMVANSGSVKLLDFGIAFSSMENREATTSNMVKGKDQYYAPEQLIGAPLDGRTDQFALALCLFEMLVLKRFFTRTSTDTETQLHLRIAQLTPESVEGILKPANIDQSLKSIIHHALAPSRDERFPNCGEFGDALRIFSQRRGWLFTAVDARKEIDALFAMPDALDKEKTNPSGKRINSTAPRRVPGSTVQFAPLTPGRTASTPPVPPIDDGTSPSKPSVKAVAPGSTPAPQRQLERQFFSPAEDDDASSEQERSRSKSASRKPSETAQRRRVELQDELYHPKTSAKKMLALPAAILAATLLVGALVVKFLVLSTDKTSNQTAEVVQTPEQVRADREAAERAADTAPSPPQLAVAPVVDTPLAVAPAPAPGPRARPKGNKDSKAVDALLAQQYGGGRPVVNPDSPDGTVNGVPAGPRRRSLDTVMIGEAGGPAAGAGPRLPKGTSMAAKLSTPADSSQPSPVTAVITTDVVVDGQVAVAKGATVVCMTSPAGARLNLNCDTLHLGRTAVTIEATAIGADKRVGLPLPRTISTDPGVGDVAKDSAINTARNILGRVAPDGVAGDVTNGAADTATGAARGMGRAPADGPAALVPAGTKFTLFISSSN